MSVLCLWYAGLLSDINGIRWRYTTQMVLISEQLSSCLMFLFLLFWPNCYNVNHPDILEAWMKFLHFLRNLSAQNLQIVAVCSSIYFNTWYLILQYWYFSCFKVFWFKQHQQHIGSQCHRTLKRDQISAPHEPKIHVKRKRHEPKIGFRCAKCASSWEKNLS